MNFKFLIVLLFVSVSFIVKADKYIMLTEYEIPPLIATALQDYSKVCKSLKQRNLIIDLNDTSFKIMNTWGPPFTNREKLDGLFIYHGDTLYIRRRIHTDKPITFLNKPLIPTGKTVPVPFFNPRHTMVIDLIIGEYHLYEGNLYRDRVIGFGQTLPKTDRNPLEEIAYDIFEASDSIFSPSDSNLFLMCIYPDMSAPAMKRGYSVVVSPIKGLPEKFTVDGYLQKGNKVMAISNRDNSDFPIPEEFKNFRPDGIFPRTNDDKVRSFGPNTWTYSIPVGEDKPEVFIGDTPYIQLTPVSGDRLRNIDYLEKLLKWGTWYTYH